MSSPKSKALLAIGAIILFAAVAAYYQFFLRSPQASAVADETIDSILQSFDDEKIIIDTEDGDLSVTTSDSQAIGDFGQSYNEDDL